MAKRRFKLPTSLNKKQFEIRALALEGQHLIIGGPGTGKSVMALLRARRLASEQVHYRFLLFNHTLRQSSDQLFEGVLSSKQWQSWFLKLYKDHINHSIPRLDKRDGSHLAPFDWPNILTTIQECNNEKTPSIEKPFLIIDEGQDMPSLFYESLVNLGFLNFFVVADQNQQIIHNENSTREDIENSLGLDTDEVIELEENHRNNFSIALLTQQFYTGDPASPLPKLPDPPKYNATKPLLFSYRKNQFSRIIDRILIMAINKPNILIGIICPNNTIREKYYKELNKLSLERQRIVSISTYHSNNQNELRFDEGGIMVLNAQACKGLEFDIVFLADIDQHVFYDQDANPIKKLFYVMISRAIDQIILLRQSEIISNIDNIIPVDKSILEQN